jgi:hypothetical protein
VQYEGYVLDEAWNAKCCQEAINRGIPMDGKYSIRPFMGIGVALTSTCYAHTDHATKMWICLFESVVIAIDDYLNGELDMEHVYYFNERFVNCQPQGNPALSAFDTLLREAPLHYSPLVSNLITTSMLDFVSSLLVDHETKDMEVCISEISFKYSAFTVRRFRPRPFHTPSIGESCQAFRSRLCYLCSHQRFLYKTTSNPYRIYPILRAMRSKVLYQ